MASASVLDEKCVVCGATGVLLTPRYWDHEPICGPCASAMSNAFDRFDRWPTEGRMDIL